MKNQTIIQTFFPINVPLNDLRNLRFSLFVCTICNLKCSYCYARQTKKWNEFLNYEAFLSIFNKIRTLKKPYEINLLGGEPTLWKFLSTSIEKFQSDPFCKKIEFFTNGIKKINVHSNKTTIFLTYHGESKEYMKLFLQNAEYYMQNNKIFINIPNTLAQNDISQLIGFCIKNNVKYHIQNIFIKGNFTQNESSGDDFDLFKYNDKIINLTQAISEGLTFKNWKCLQCNYLLEKNFVIDECSDEKITYEQLKSVISFRTCTKDTCFKHGDFLYYNFKYNEL